MYVKVVNLFVNIDAGIGLIQTYGILFQQEILVGQLSIHLNLIGDPPKGKYVDRDVWVVAIINLIS